MRKQITISGKTFEVIVPKFHNHGQRTGKTEYLDADRLEHIQSYANNNYDDSFSLEYNLAIIGYYAFGDTVVDLVAS